MGTSEINISPARQSIIDETYSIGLYHGSSPFDLVALDTIDNPIISRKEFPGLPVNFVADPFLTYIENTWFLFYEIMPLDSRKGIIACSSSPDLVNWKHHGTVLEEAFHLSYPQVFQWNGIHYMIPETFQDGSVHLYQSLDFPYNWIKVRTLLNMVAVDATLHRWQKKWWLFVCDRPKYHNRLRLFYSDDLYGDWKEHPSSPLHSGDNTKSRPAGKLFEWNDRLFRTAQDCAPFYGSAINVFEIIELNEFNYREKPIRGNPLFKGNGSDWNAISMHHLDVHEIKNDYWIGVVDGRRN